MRLIFKKQLKPQDSFGEFDILFLDLQKVQEIIREQHQTFLQSFGMTYCNATRGPMAYYHYVQ